MYYCNACLREHPGEPALQGESVERVYIDNQLSFQSTHYTSVSSYLEPPVLPRAASTQVQTIMVCADHVDDYFECDECAMPVHVENRVPVSDPDAAAMCEMCEEAQHFDCEHCSERTHNNYMHEGAREQGRSLCEDCVEDHYTSCDGCIALLTTNHGVTVNDDVTLCTTCLHEGNFASCNHCNRWHHTDNLVGDDFTDLCRRCYENYYFNCEACDRIVHDNYYAGDGRCEDCDHYNDDEGQDASPYSRSVNASVLRGSTRSDNHTFGIEVETLFPRGRPWCLGGYGSDTPAPMDFYSGWRGEEDCTVDAEFPSPVLRGAEGLAEVAATFDILKRAGAEMGYRAGQHITVCTGEVCPCRVMQVTLICEEALYASTGAFGRMTGDFAPTIKGHYSRDSVKEGRGVYGSHLCANIRSGSYNLIEFRYPPGTLQPEQMVMNVALSKLMVLIANTLDNETLNKYLEDSLAIEADVLMSREEKINAQVKMGLELIAYYGDWHRDGELKGLLYDPDDAPTIRVEDDAHGHDYAVTLPGRAQIMGRMKRQITRFYAKLGTFFLNSVQETLQIVDLHEPVENDEEEDG